MVDDRYILVNVVPNHCNRIITSTTSFHPKKLQFGAAKCKKFCIGKTHEEVTCSDLYIDGWKEIVVKQIENGDLTDEDILEGEDLMQTEDSETYLGDIVTNNGKNLKT